MNTDISGIGVRISFYLQTLFLGCLSARSRSLDEVTGSLYTLVATNVAMAVSSLILGLKPEPEISFHDALVVFYLLTLCWVTNTCSLASCNGFEGGAKFLQLFSVLQSIVVFAFAFVVLITARTFGSNPECNSHAVLVFLRPFPVFNAGRIVGWVVTVAVFALYSFMTVKDYLSKPLAWMKGKKIQDSVLPMPTHNTDSNKGSGLKYGDSSTPNDSFNVVYTRRRQSRRYAPNVHGTLILQIFAILVLWAVTVMNTELLIILNRFQHSDEGQSIWQFGQILPLLLVVLPFTGLINAFRTYGIRKKIPTRM